MRRERFIEELDGYARQVEEFVGYGDLAEVNKYMKKAQALNTRLETASDKVQQFCSWLVVRYFIC
jgi:dynein heavy chain